MVERAIDSFVIGVDVEVATEEMEEVSKGTGSGVEVERLCKWFLWVSWSGLKDSQCVFYT